MKTNCVTMKKILLSFVFLLGIIAIPHSFSLAQETELALLLNEINARQDSYPKHESWKATVVNTTTKMDKNWQPKEVTVVKKILTVVNQEQTEEVLEVLETKKGVTKDITKKYIEKAKKQKEKAQKKKLQGKKEDNGRSFTLSSEEMYPFSQEKRENYYFSKLEDSFFEGRPVYLLQSKAKTKDEKLWEGTYYIDQNTFDVLKLEIKPSKNPKYVKEFEFEMSFQVLPEGYHVPEKVRMKINGGIFIKRIRMVVEGEYSEYEMIDPEENGI